MRFTAAGLVALVVVGVVTSVATRRLGEREAITDARGSAVAKALGVVEPAVTDALLAQDAAAVQAVDRVVRTGVLDGSLVRVKLWQRDGTVLYADETRLIGQRFELGEDEVRSLDTGLIDAEVSRLDRPENVYEAPLGKLLEVYLPIRTPSGAPVLFEAYYRYSLVQESSNRLWRTFAPLTLGALLLLGVVQLPLAWSLARSLRQRHEEREGLLERAVEASDVERRRIASDLHDGAVQDLAGAALSLSAAARRDGVATADRDLLTLSAGQVRAAIKDLRSLIVDLYPPDFDDLDCATALGELLARAAESGLECTLDTDGVVVEPGRGVSRLVYRACQEALRNVLAHARASSVRVVLASDERSTSLGVTDDGCGFDADTFQARRTEGHMGLVALRGLVSDAGGSLDVESRPGTGTTVTLEVPR
jgi:signal transduction histidine kinase